MHSLRHEWCNQMVVSNTEELWLEFRFQAISTPFRLAQRMAGNLALHSLA